MIRPILVRLTVCAALVAFSPGPLQFALGEDILRAGFSTSDLTPPIGLEMAGFGPYLERRATDIHDRLKARAMVMELAGKRIAIVSCDLLAITLELTQRVRSRVEEATGIAGHHVMVSATHTHSGPSVPRSVGWGEQDEQYLTDLHEKIGQAVIQAANQMRPVEISYGEARVEGIAVNREYEGGSIDEKVRVLKFMRGERLVGFIPHYSIHPVVMSEDTHLITGDLTGVSIDKVMGRHPGSVGIYLQGSCGDINPVYAHLPQEVSLKNLELLSNRFAADIGEALRTASPVSVAEIGMQVRRIDLPQVVPDKALVVWNQLSAARLLKQQDLPQDARRWLRFQKDAAEAVLRRFDRIPLNEKRTQIQVARLGRILIVANPGEVFLRFAKQTADQLPAYKVLVTGYTNDFVGYIPTPDMYHDVSPSDFEYPAYFVPWAMGEFRYREDVGEFMVREMVQLARELLDEKTP